MYDDIQEIWMKKALVVYSSWTGSTREIADYIAEIINKDLISVKTTSAKNMNIDLDDIDLCIIGTSIHAGRTMSSFRKFIKKNLKTLSNKTVAIFVSCANMMHNTEDSQQETLGWLNKTLKSFDNLKPISIGLFGGATITSGEDFKKLNIFLKRIILAMHKNMMSQYGKSDFRDWNKIEAWAKDLIAHHQ